MEQLFFSEILTAKLEKIKTCALSALEAPAGYGKTTAVRRLFSEGDASVRRFTAVEGWRTTVSAGSSGRSAPSTKSPRAIWRI